MRALGRALKAFSPSSSLLLLRAGISSLFFLCVPMPQSLKRRIKKEEWASVCKQVKEGSSAGLETFFLLSCVYLVSSLLLDVWENTTLSFFSWLLLLLVLLASSRGRSSWSLRKFLSRLLGSLLSLFLSHATGRYLLALSLKLLSFTLLSLVLAAKLRTRKKCVKYENQDGIVRHCALEIQFAGFCDFHYNTVHLLCPDEKILIRKEIFNFFSWDLIIYDDEEIICNQLVQAICCHKI